MKKTRQQLTADIVKRSDGYWVTNLPFGFPDIGPYTTRTRNAADSAEDARLGILQTARRHRAFWMALESKDTKQAGAG